MDYELVESKSFCMILVNFVKFNTLIYYTLLGLFTHLDYLGTLILPTRALLSYLLSTTGAVVWVPQRNYPNVEHPSEKIKCIMCIDFST